MPVVLVTADDVQIGKPDLEPFRLGASRLGQAPARLPGGQGPAVPASPRPPPAARLWGCRTTYHGLAAPTVVDLTLLHVQVTTTGITVHPD